MRNLTRHLSVYAPLLTIPDILGEFDFIRAKAKLALDMNAAFPI